MEYTFYKIYCKDENIKDCYIGKTNDIRLRKNLHSSRCNDTNYKFKLYEFIRNNGGWNNWEIEILEIVNCSNKDSLCLERKWYDNLNPTLNTLRPNQTNLETETERAKIYRLNNYEEKTRKVNCECGGKYTMENKNRHLKSKKHLDYLQNKK